MIATTPNIHIQPVFHPSIPYPRKGPPPEMLFEKNENSVRLISSDHSIPSSLLCRRTAFLTHVRSRHHGHAVGHRLHVIRHSLQVVNRRML